MIEHYFSRTSVLTRLRHGLLGPYLDELATTLQQQGYTRDSIRHYLRKPRHGILATSGNLS